MISSSGYKLGAFAVRLFMAPFARRRMIGAGHVPSEGGCILAPNHISHFDPPLIGISVRRPIDWMAMQELFAHPASAALFRWVGAFPVGRGTLDRAAVRTAIARLQQGRLVGVFPEGGLRTGPGSVLEGAPLKPGVAALAQMTSAPVVPCLVLGSDALYGLRRWIPVRRTPVWIVFGEPLPPPGTSGDKAAARADFERRLGDAIRELYVRTLREEAVPAECLPQTPQRRKGRA